MELIRKTINEILKDRAKNTPESIGLIYEGASYTWREIDLISESLCFDLKKLGVKKGDKVGLYGMNSASWLFHFYAVQKIGAVAVLFSTCFKENDVERGIVLAGVDYLFYSEGYKGEDYKDIVARLNDKHIESVKMYLYMEKTEKTWKEKIKGEVLITEENIDPFDVALVIFTSGTTSYAKGVMLTHHNVVNNARQMNESMRWNKDDRMVVTVPLFHSFGITSCILASIDAGFEIVLMGHYRTVEVCQTIEKYKGTILNGVPSMFLAMLRNDERLKYDLSSVKSGIIAGSPINPKEYIEICSIFDDIKLQPSYGQSESSPCITIADYDDTIEKKSVTDGKVIEHVELRIRKLKDGSICKPGEEGEIEVRGYNVMKGYIGSGCETDKTITLDGWLKTGDLGVMSEDGYLSITGRLKNVIIRGGENVSPVEVENAIKDVVKNSEVKVFGVKSEVVQEEIVAAIETEGDKTLEGMKKEIQTHLKKTLCGYKIPRYIYFIDSMPRLGSGKIDEKNLKLSISQMVEGERKYNTTQIR